jgi:hypothetical protein
MLPAFLSRRFVGLLEMISESPVIRLILRHLDARLHQISPDFHQGRLQL